MVTVHRTYHQNHHRTHETIHVHKKHKEETHQPNITGSKMIPNVSILSKLPDKQDIIKRNGGAFDKTTETTNKY